MKTDEWLTPDSILDVLGPFDLDPCAQQRSRRYRSIASENWDIHNDGLSRTWFGMVWMNPPYGSDLDRWLAKMSSHGRGFALIFARTETNAFFNHVWDCAHAVLFLRGRLNFLLPNGLDPGKNSGAPSVIVAYGREAAARLMASDLDGKLVILKT